ncbi:hypothetical protein AAFF_G00432150 [Aldrovandia affinis]|uniref:Gypsy retrotransposon integrase-like protein 1 n=1 Tax=Aldrovandia affinis TaxID=143900 RepID=A0AAD7R353_9TELE|nr:hypothetical protein AAFF_G00432150 [Aldrovandia affinis]
MVMRILKQWDKLTVLDGILYRVTRDPVTKHKRFQFVLPDSLKSQALAGVHDLAGHQGQPRTLSLVRQRFFWYDVEKDVRSYVRNCARNVLRDDSVCDYNAYVKSLATDLQSAMLLAQRHSSVEQKHQSDQYNKKVKGLPLSVGDRVLVANKSGRGKRKLADRWEPAVYTVVASKPQFHIYKIRDRDGQVRTVHRNLLLAVNFLLLTIRCLQRMTFGVDTVSHDPSNVPDPEAAVSEPESVAEHSVVDSSSWLNGKAQSQLVKLVPAADANAPSLALALRTTSSATSALSTSSSQQASQACPTCNQVPSINHLVLSGIIPEGPARILQPPQCGQS